MCSSTSGARFCIASPRKNSKYRSGSLTSRRFCQRWRGPNARRPRRPLPRRRLRTSSRAQQKWRASCCGKQRGSLISTRTAFSAIGRRFRPSGRRRSCSRLHGRARWSALRKRRSSP
eukprot:Amastigsp_a342549_20.p5 type:complete len:117 gc:universal Amastigsp_a342549_20:273-623(+)